VYKIKFKTGKFIIIACLTFLFQATLINSMALGPCKPDFVLMIVIFFGLYNGVKPGMACGVISGLAVDVLSSGIFGINAFVYGLIGFCAGVLQERVYTSHFLTKIIVSLCGGVIATLVYYVLAIHFYRLPSFLEQGGIMAGNILYTTVLNSFFFTMLEKLVTVKSFTLV